MSGKGNLLIVLEPNTSLERFCLRWWGRGVKAITMHALVVILV